MRLSESVVLVVTSILTGVAALLTLIGLTTPKWLKIGYGLWNCNSVCAPPSATLTILALLLLVTSVVLLIILFIRLFPRTLRFLPLASIAIATLFLLAATASYLRKFQVVGYSYELIITAHALGFITSVILAFWYGTTMDESTSAHPPRANIPAPTIVLPPARVL